jgi:hypothetical protein
MELTLGTEEQELLLKILERYHQVLLNEIAHTDRREFKQGLLEDKKLLESLVGRLQGTAVQ